MDWTKQSQEMFQTWTDLQMKTWKNWLEVIQGEEKFDAAQVWQKTMNAWQEAVKGTLDAQVESTRIWAEGISSVEGAPKESAEWAKQVQEMTKQWTDMQEQLWNSWFEAVKKVDLSKMGGNWGEVDGQNVLNAWQDIAKKAMNSQNEWLTKWTDMMQLKKGES